MEDPDSMEVFLDQLDEPFDNEDQEQDSFFQSSQSQSQKNDDLHLKAAPTTATTQSQNSQEKSPEVAKERLSIFHHLKSCPGNNVSFSSLVMDLDEDGKNNAPQDIRLLGVRVPASDALTLGFNLFVKSINTLEAPINTLVPTGSQSALEDCSRAVHDYLKLLRAVSSQGSPSDIRRCLHKVQAVIGPLSHLKPDIGRGTKVFGSKDCLLAQHAMLAVHLTTAACLQRMSVESEKTVDNQHMVQFLAWCAVQRSKVVDRVSGNLLNCFCVKTCWRLAFQWAKSEESFWTDFAGQFRSSPVDLWPALGAVAPLVYTPGSKCFEKVLQSCVKDSIAHQPDASEMLTITSSLKNIVKELHFPADIVILSHLWSYHIGKLNEDDNPHGNSLGFQPVGSTSTIVSWKGDLLKLVGSRESDSRYTAFLQLVYLQLSNPQTEAVKAVQFVNRIRSNVPRKVPDLNATGIRYAVEKIFRRPYLTGIRRVMDLLHVIMLARSGQLSKQLVDAVAAILKSKPSTKTLDLFLRGMATCCLLAENPSDLFGIYMSRMEEVGTNLRNPCLSTYCDLIVERADLLMSHQHLIPSDDVIKPLFSKPIQSNIVGQFIKALALLAEKMSDFLQRTSNVVTLSSEEAECRKRIVINLKRIQGSVYPLVKTMWQVTSVEEAISPLPLVSHIAQFVMVVIQSKSGTASDNPATIVLTDPYVHPSLTLELTLRDVRQNHGSVGLWPHVGAWIKCACLLPPDDSEELHRAVSEGLAELKMFRRSVQEGTPHGNFFAAINNKVNFETHDMERRRNEMQARYKQVFDVFKEICRTWLPGLVKEQFFSQKVLQFYRVGSSMIKFCCPLLYSKEPAGTKLLPILLLNMYISPSLKTPTYNIPSSQLKAISMCLPDILQGIGTLGQITNNGYIARAVKEIITAYLPRYPVNKAHPIYRAFEVPTGPSFYYDTVDFKALGVLIFRSIKEQPGLMSSVDALNLIKHFLKESPKKIELKAAAISEMAQKLLELRLHTKDKKVECLSRELVQVLAVGGNASWMEQPMRYCINARLNLDRVSTFKLIWEVCNANPVLAKALIPTVENAIMRIESPYGLESLKTQLKELKQKYLQF